MKVEGKYKKEEQFYECYKFYTSFIVYGPQPGRDSAATTEHIVYWDSCMRMTT